MLMLILMGSPKPLADQLGYWIRMRLLFKPNVTCRPTQNFWFVNVFSTFRRQNSVVKNWQLVGGRAAGAPSTVQPVQWLNRALCINVCLLPLLLLLLQCLAMKRRCEKFERETASWKCCSWSDESDEILGIRLRIFEYDEELWILLVVDDRIISEHLAVWFQRRVDVSRLADRVLAGQDPRLVDALMSVIVRRRVFVFRRLPPLLRKVHSLPVHRCTSSSSFISLKIAIKTGSYEMC